MAKDPAILAYPRDIAADIVYLDRQARGAYLEFMLAQYKFGRLSLIMIQKICGTDFEKIWPQLQLVLSKDDGGAYYIEWLEESIENRKKYSETQRKRIEDYWKAKKESSVIPGNNRGNSVDIPSEEEEEIEEEYVTVKAERIEKGVQGEEKGKDVESLKAVFEIFRRLYPGTKRGLETEFQNLTKKHKDWRQIVPLLSDRLAYQVRAREDLIGKGEFVPSWRKLETWINQRCWEEEISIQQSGSQKRNGASVSGTAGHYSSMLKDMNL